MATTMTLAQLRTAAQQRADMVNDTFVSASEWTSYINQSYFELYDLLVQSYGNDYFVATPATFTTDGVNQRFALDTSTLVYKLLGVEVQVSGTSGAANGSYVTLKPFDFAERNSILLPNTQNLVGRTNLRYRLSGENLWLMPIPAGGQTIRYWYVPRLVPLAGESDACDGISGWTEYIIVDAAIKAKDKEESSTTVLREQKKMLIQRIESASQNRDAGSPATVADTSGSGGYGYDGGYGWQS